MISDSTNKKQTLVAVIMIAGLVALIVAALVGGIGFSVEHLRSVFDPLDPQVVIVLGAASLVALLCAWLIAAAIRSVGRRADESNRLCERTRIYQAFLESVANAEGRFGEAAAPLAATLFLIGGAPVVKEYRAFAQMLSGGSASKDEVRMQINRLMLAMRRDVGESTFGLEQEDWSGWLQNSASDKSCQQSNGATLAQRPEAVSLPLRL